MYDKKIEEAEGRGYLLVCKRARLLEEGWLARCERSGRPYLRVSGGSRYASMTLDLAPAGRCLSAEGEREVGEAFRRRAREGSVLFSGSRTVGVVRFPADRALSFAEELLEIARGFSVEDGSGVEEEAGLAGTAPHPAGAVAAGGPPRLAPVAVA